MAVRPSSKHGRTYRKPTWVSIADVRRRRATSITSCYSRASSSRAIASAAQCAKRHLWLRRKSTRPSKGPKMTDPADKLRELALSIREDLKRPWSVQTSNSFRRIGTDLGDGNVLCAITQRPDGHPDLHATPHVLDYIVAAHPLTILQLIRERDSARHALHFLNLRITGSDEVFQEAGRMAGIPLRK